MFIDDDTIHRFGITEKGESLEQVFDRVVSSIGSVEKIFPDTELSYDEFISRLKGLLRSRKFIPSTSILMNAGRFDDLPLSACTVPAITLTEEFSKIKKSVDKLHLSGMGTGFNLDDIEDPIELVRKLNQIGLDGQENKKQLRPVGNMGIMSLDHPKILEFINLKNSFDDKWVFNFSISVNNELLSKLKQGEDIILKDGNKLRSEFLLDSIARSIHQTGDPGLVFIDRLNEDNQVPTAGEYISLAPCGEVGLSAGETCQFGYLNLSQFYIDGKFNYQKLAKAIELGVRFLDDVVEYNLSRYNDEQSVRITKNKRKIGLGVCGFADLLNEMKLSYASNEARQFARNLFSFINFISKKESVKLAKERGPFGKFDESKYVGDESIVKKYSREPTETVSTKQWLQLDDEIKKFGIRNCATVALPPTGRSSMIIKTSPSIEPNFEDILNISPEDQLLMVDSIQRYVDESVSKTVNVPESTTPEEIKRIIKQSLELRLKGITVYRDKSRKYQPAKLVESNSITASNMETREQKEKYNFQYCQKMVVFSSDFEKVLLCRRKGEADYDGVYSFIGGKMETSDEDIVEAMRREKNEEVGENVRLKLCAEFSNNLTFKKKSGDYMILPHYLAVHMEGEIKLNEEYDDYRWVPVKELEEFEPKIENIPETVAKMLKLKQVLDEDDFETI